MSYDAFLSYARLDGEKTARRLEEALVKHGLSIWRDQRNIDPYQDFSAEIEVGIRKSACVVVCVTPSVSSSHDSFVRREIIYAQNLGKPIIPAVLPNAVVPILINHLTWIPFYTGKGSKQRLDFHGGVARLLERLKAGVPKSKDTVVSNDPLRPFLTELYEQIVEVLSRTVINFVPLESVGASKTVKGGAESARALPLTFLARSRDETDADASTPTRYGSLQEAFKASKGRLLLLGKPGSGKTTTLLAFAREAVAQRLADPDLAVPIVAPIATWDSSDPDLVKWLAKNVTALKLEQIEHLIAHDHALLLLDGLDELGHLRKEAKDGRTVDPRCRFIDQLPHDTSIVISCRVPDYDAIGQRLVLGGAVVLQPLDDIRMARFLENQQDLLAAVEADEHLRSMVRTPLLLSLFAYAYEDLGEEARRLSDLTGGPSELRYRVLRAYVEKRLDHERKRWQEAGDPSLTVDIDMLYEVFGKIAKRVVLNNVSDLVIGRSSVLTPYSFHTAVGNDAPRWIEFAERLHLIVAIDKDRWRFIHALLLDHFAFEPWLTDFLDPAGHHTLAAAALSEIGDSRAIDPLCTFMRNESNSEYDRAHVASALANFNGPKVDLTRILEGLESDKVRAPIVLALGALGDETVLEDLCNYASCKFGPGEADLRLSSIVDPAEHARRAADILRRFDDPRATSAVEAYKSNKLSVDYERWARANDRNYEG